MKPLEHVLLWRTTKFHFSVLINLSLCVVNLHAIETRRKIICRVKLSLADAGKSPSDLDAILLVGGSPRTPLVARMIEQPTGLIPREEIHPDLCVALCAGVMASRLGGHEVERVLVDVTHTRSAFPSRGIVACLLSALLQSDHAQGNDSVGEPQFRVQVRVHTAVWLVYATLR
jgi:Hsp70 protein